MKEGKLIFEDDFLFLIISQWKHPQPMLFQVHMWDKKLGIGKNYRTIKIDCLHSSTVKIEFPDPFQLAVWREQMERNSKPVNQVL